MTSNELINDLIREEEARFGPMIETLAEENVELCLIEDEQTQKLVKQIETKIQIKHVRYSLGVKRKRS